VSYIPVDLRKSSVVLFVLLDNTYPSQPLIIILVDHHIDVINDFWVNLTLKLPNFKEVIFIQNRLAESRLLKELMYPIIGKSILADSELI
jgi:hypothetical protein